MRAHPPPRRRLRRWISAAMVAALLAPATTGAHDDAATRALRLHFAHGLSLEAAGRWADALARFEQVAHARPTANVTFHVALCLEQLGRLRHARRTYREARVAARAGAPDLLAEIEARLLELDVRTPRIVLDIAGAPEGVSLLLDGAPVSTGRPIRADPGPHVAVALRRGVPVAAAAFSAHEHRTQRVILRVYPAPAEPPPP